MNSQISTISIVTPSYNQGQFIEETIKSVLTQEGDFYLDYIIMDGSSQDESVEIIKKYDRLLKDGKWPISCRGIQYHWVSELDNGQADAVNKGFGEAKGEILGWLNSDDTYLPNAFSKIINYFRDHEDIMMVYGEGYHINKNGSIIERYYTELFDFQRLAELCFICQPTVFLRRRALDKVGMLDTDLHYCMDYDFWIRIAKRLEIGYLPEYFANSRMYADNKTKSKRVEVHDEILKVVKKHYHHIPDSWIFAYAHAYVERYFRGDTRLKNYLFNTWIKSLFVYKSIQKNREIPLARIKRFFNPKSTKNK